MCRLDAPPQAMELSLNFLPVGGTDPHSCPILRPASRCSEKTNGPGFLPQTQRISGQPHNVI